MTQRRKPTRGAVACGHPTTARAATDILRAGGNAIDAAVAAAFTTFVAEPSLTTIAGGGFMLAHDHQAGDTKLYDFFSTMPGKGRKRTRTKDLDFYAIDLDFGDSTQEFHIGTGAAAVPGNVHGLVTAHKKHGRLPLHVVLEPAIAAARRGITLGEKHAFVLSVVRGTVMATAGSRALYAPSGKLLQAGETFRNPDLATTLECIAKDGCKNFYRGDIADAIVRDIGKQGGLITHEDLASFRTRVRKPLAVKFAGRDIITNPLPSWGGRLIAFGLELMSAAKLPRGIAARDPQLLRALAATMWLTNDARARYQDFSPRVIAAYQQRLRDYLRSDDYALGDATAVPSGAGNTTHLSVMDAEGNAASITTSHGEGNGVCVGGTGIILNNLLGEEDINPHGWHQWDVGAHLPSMMAPTMIMQRGTPQITLGSAGSNRLRTAIMQTIAYLLVGKSSLSRAVNGPRIHWERGKLDIEPGFSQRALSTLTQCEPNHHVWSDKNLYFGGLHAVAKHGRTFTGAGDHRRGGVWRNVQ